LMELMKLGKFTDLNTFIRYCFRLMEYVLVRSSESWRLQLVRGDEVVEVNLDFIQREDTSTIRNLRLVVSNPPKEDPK
jgi:hypothetical protein